MKKQKINTFLWFNDNAEEAVNFYISVFKDGQIDNILHLPGGPDNSIVINFTLFGQEYIALNGGPDFKFNEAMSLFVNCETQAEVDQYWAKLTSDGGEEGPCGWLKDKFGLSWQIVPTKMMELFNDNDKSKATRAVQAMMKMSKLDLKKVQGAFDGK